MGRTLQLPPEEGPPRPESTDKPAPLVSPDMFEEAFQSLEGEQVDKWHLKTLIGKGGMSAVYKATHLWLDQEAAVKVLLPTISNDKNTLRRFHQEAVTMGHIQHPNVIEIKDFGMDKVHGYFMVMEYLRGQALDALIPQAPFPSGWLIGIFDQLCDALEATHKAGVIHRDLKPANIFLTKTEEPQRPHLKLLDFGVAKVRLEAQEQRLTTTGAIIGTPSYLAPEQVNNERRELSPATDIYALGVLLYEALTGELPLQGTSLFRQVLLVMQHEPALLGTHREELTDTKLEALAKQMLAKDPLERPQSASEAKALLHEALQEWQENDPLDLPERTPHIEWHPSTPSSSELKRPSQTRAGTLSSSSALRSQPSVDAALRKTPAPGSSQTLPTPDPAKTESFSDLPAIDGPDAHASTLMLEERNLPSADDLVLPVRIDSQDALLVAQGDEDEQVIAVDGDAETLKNEEGIKAAIDEARAMHQEQKSRPFRWIGPLVGVIVLLALGVFWFMQRPKEAKNNPTPGRMATSQQPTTAPQSAALQKGMVAFATGKYQLAIKTWRAALPKQETPHPLTLKLFRHIAKAYEKAGYIQTAAGTLAHMRALQEQWKRAKPKHPALYASLPSEAQSKQDKVHQASLQTKALTCGVSAEPLLSQLQKKLKAKEHKLAALYYSKLRELVLCQPELQYKLWSLLQPTHPALACQRGAKMLRWGQVPDNQKEKLRAGLRKQQKKIAAARRQLLTAQRTYEQTKERKAQQALKEAFQNGFALSADVALHKAWHRWLRELFLRSPQAVIRLWPDVQALQSTLRGSKNWVWLKQEWPQIPTLEELKQQKQAFQVFQKLQVLRKRIKRSFQKGQLQRLTSLQTAYRKRRDQFTRLDTWKLPQSALGARSEQGMAPILALFQDYKGAFDKAQFPQAVRARKSLLEAVSALDQPKMQRALTRLLARDRARQTRASALLAKAQVAYKASQWKIAKKYFEGYLKLFPRSAYKTQMKTYIRSCYCAAPPYPWINCKRTEFPKHHPRRKGQ